jgi:uncharacterized protein DUF4129
VRAERRAFVTILAGRCWSAATTFAAIAALLDALLGGRAPLSLLGTALALCGITLALVAILRERGSIRTSGAITAVAMAATAIWGLSLAGRALDPLGILTRIVGFAILGEAYLWGLLSIARGLQRWREVRDGATLALGAVVVAALVPAPIDRAALPILALTVALMGAVAMSLARSTEELGLGGSELEGKPIGSAAGATAFGLGILAIVLALALPAIEAFLARVAAEVGPFLDAALLLVLLPLGYLAAAVVAAAIWLRDLIRPGPFPTPRLPILPMTPEELAAQSRAIEQTRPVFIGAVEVLVALVALAFAAALVLRIATERAASVGEGVSVDREGVEGLGVRETLASLFSRPAPRPRAPSDDGTTRTLVVRMYWRLLDLAERAGPGRRLLSETPAEHEDRLLRADERWRDADAVVRLFEEVRYGELEPEADRLAAADAALRRAEAFS